MVELGKYATAVLGSWAITLGLFALLVVWTLRQAARSKKRLAEAEARRREQDG